MIHHVGLPAEIKGLGGSLGLVLSEECAFDDILTEVKKLLEKDASLKFLQGTEISLKFGKRVFSEAESIELQKMFQEQGLKLVYDENDESGLKTSSKKTESISRKTGIETEETVQQTESTVQDEMPSNDSVSEMEMKDKNPETDEMIEDQNASEAILSQTEMTPGIHAEQPLVIRQTMRSGQSVRTAQSVILFGDLNSGAEIISEGDVVVLGNIRGLVHAGAAGNDQAIIIGLRITPTQIRIASEISQPPPEASGEARLGPEKVFVEDGQIVIENQACEPYELLHALSDTQRSENRQRKGSGGMLISVGTIRW